MLLGGTAEDKNQLECFDETCPADDSRAPRWGRSSMVPD